MKNYDKNKESSYSKYWEVNNLNEREMSEKLPANCLKWVEDTLRVLPLKFMFKILKSYKNSINI